MKLLIEQGADVNECVNSTPLEAACRSDFVEIVRFLIENGAKVVASPAKELSYLKIAIEIGATDLVLLLLEHGAPPNESEDNMELPDYKTVLQIACGRYGGIELAKLLLDRGADVNARLEFKDTALATACGRGSIDNIKLLLQRGAQADPDAFVAAIGRVEVIELLHEQRPELNTLSEDEDGNTALEYACGISFGKERIEYLLKIGADEQSPKFQKTFGRALVAMSRRDDLQAWRCYWMLEQVPGFMT